MVTFDQVLRLAQQLPPTDQARLGVALKHMEEVARTEQIARNQVAIAMLNEWSVADEEDDGDESWDEMLQALDQHRESVRVLYPHLQADSVERIS
jgi:hypothetical protein